MVTLSTMARCCAVRGLAELGIAARRGLPRACPTPSTQSSLSARSAPTAAARVVSARLRISSHAPCASAWTTSRVRADGGADSGASARRRPAPSDRDLDRAVMRAAHLGTGNSFIRPGPRRVEHLGRAATIRLTATSLRPGSRRRPPHEPSCGHRSRARAAHLGHRTGRAPAMRSIRLCASPTASENVVRGR